MPNTNMKTKFLTGKKGDIESAKQKNTIDEGDFIVTSDTDEFAFINKNKETKFLKSRSQKAYTLKGTDLGALKAGQTIPENIDMDGLLNLITQKSIPATYTKPTVTLANNAGTAAGNVEAGTSVTPKLRATFNKNDAGDLTTISIKKANASVKDGTASPLDYAGEALVIGDETVTFTATASYGDGAIKNDNLGQPSPSGQIKAGTVNSSGYSFTGQRNLFYGTGIGTAPELTSDVIRNLQNKKLNPTQGYSFSMTVATGQQYVIIAYRDNIRDLNKVHYVEGNDPNLGKNFKKSTLQVADARGGENGLSGYKVFLLQLSTPGKAPMTLNVTI